MYQGKVAVITANMGNFEKSVGYVRQSVNYDFYMFTDRNFAPRIKSMTPRLQARIVKMFGWQMAPDYDLYIWVDSSFSLLHPDSVKWLIEQCGDKDMAVFAHPNRKTIQEEGYYLRKCRRNGDPYIRERYKNEMIEDQMEEIMADKGYVDNRLFASTFYVYRNNEKVRGMMKEWWYHTSRYHSVDQLSLPYVIWKTGCVANAIPVKHHNDFKIPYLTLTRYL